MPWHLATREFVDQVDRVLRPDGVYAINVIDHPPMAFVKAEAATLAAVFEHVAVLGPADRLAGRTGGNLILIALAPADRRGCHPVAQPISRRRR